jgi:thioredoxin 1
MVRLFFLFAVFASWPANAAELLIFTADWCGPCQLFKADIKTEPDILENYEWGYVDFENEKELSAVYSVTTVPTFLILENNAVIVRRVGYRGPEDLKSWLQNRKLKRFMFRR